MGKKILFFDKPEAEASWFKPLTVEKDGPTFNKMKMKKRKSRATEIYCERQKTGFIALAKSFQSTPCILLGSAEASQES